MMMSNERLNYLADRFVQHQIGPLLQISFADYLLDPEGADQTAFYLLAGGSLCTYYQPPKPVMVPRKLLSVQLKTAI